MDASMKRRILKIIYEMFGHWTKNVRFACARGCPVCCTRDVMVTKPEAQLLLDYIVAEHGAPWLAEKLNDPPIPWPLSRTTNDYAAACLEGKEVTERDRRRNGVCPFLEHEICSVYPARPFSCRCFASTRVCRIDSAALLPPHYLSGATALSQVIEHLGQFEPWGNMLDLLFLLAPPAVVGDGAENHRSGPAGARTIARSNCLTAKPLPGFLVEEDDAEPVGSLLDSIFTYPVGEKSVEDILNNR